MAVGYIWYERFWITVWQIKFQMPLPLAQQFHFQEFIPRTYQDLCERMLIEASLQTAKHWKELKCPLSGNWSYRWWQDPQRNSMQLLEGGTQVCVCAERWTQYRVEKQVVEELYTFLHFCLKKKKGIRMCLEIV